MIKILLFLLLSDSFSKVQDLIDTNLSDYNDDFNFRLKEEQVTSPPCPSNPQGLRWIGPPVQQQDPAGVHRGERRAAEGAGSQQCADNALIGVVEDHCV